MAVRKSKKIGLVINGYKVLDSRRRNGNSELLVKCESCRASMWKSANFIRREAKCPMCSRGRNYRNAKGYEHERLYERYRSILKRVYSEEKYLGVTICKEWENDYLEFRKWALENGYSDELTIDRIDNSKGYCPENCRWATTKQQANNRSSNVVVEFEGREYTLSQLADHCGLNQNTVKTRHSAGWSVDDIARTPCRSRKKWSEMSIDSQSNTSRSGT